MPTGARIRAGLFVRRVQRLKTRPQFQAALAGGTVCRTTHFALHRVALGSILAAPSADQEVSAANLTVMKPTSRSLFPIEDTWMGAMTPKRWAKRAVTRNAIKRQIYQLSTDLASRFPHAAHVVRLRASFDRKQFVSASSDALKTAVRSELTVLFNRALAAPVPVPASPHPQK